MFRRVQGLTSKNRPDYSNVDEIPESDNAMEAVLDHENENIRPSSPNQRATDDEDEVVRGEQSSAPRKSLFLPINAVSIRQAEAAVRETNINFAEEAAKPCPYISVALGIYAVEHARGHPIMRTYSENLFRMWTTRVLLSTPLFVLQHLVSGTLSQAYHLENSDVAKHLHPNSDWVLLSHNKFAPGSYILYLVDRNGNSPTPNEFRPVIKRLRDYVSGRTDSVGDALQLDNARRPQSTIADITAGRSSCPRKNKADRSCHPPRMWATAKRPMFDARSTDTETRAGFCP
jgi:hypothetical protein